MGWRAKTEHGKDAGPKVCLWQIEDAARRRFAADRPQLGH